MDAESQIITLLYLRHCHTLSTSQKQNPLDKKDNSINILKASIHNFFLLQLMDNIFNNIPTRCSPLLFLIFVCLFRHVNLLI